VVSWRRIWANRVRNRTFDRGSSHRYITRGYLIVGTLLLRVLAGIAFSEGPRAQAGHPAPIRAQSEEVVVPVLVLDEKRVNQIRKMDSATFKAKATEKNAHVLSDVTVRGLLAKDFHVFEDGKPQQIERMTVEPEFGRVRGAGAGKWVGPDLPPYTTINLFSPSWRPDDRFGPPSWLAYLIAYARPASANGSCHRVTVTVDRPHSLIFTRGDYCNTFRPAADPLNGTRAGARMEAILDSREEKNGSIDLTLAAFNTFGRLNAALTNIVVALPEEAARLFNCDKPPTIGILGIVYANDGTVVTRFSDLANLGLWSFVGVSLPRLVPSALTSCERFDVPYQYETQIDVSPGEYTVKIVVMDGERFGRAETRFRVDTEDEKRLAVSDIVLGKSYVKLQTGLQTDPALPGSYIPLISRGFETTPTAAAYFRRSDPLDFYFEIFDSRRTGPSSRTLAADLEILDAKTGRVDKRLDPMNPDSYANLGEAVVPIGGQADIGSLPSGSYQLQVRVTASDDDTAIVRTVDFIIE